MPVSFKTISICVIDTINLQKRAIFEEFFIWHFIELLLLKDISEET